MSSVFVLETAKVNGVEEGECRRRSPLSCDLRGLNPPSSENALEVGDILFVLAFNV